MSMLSGTPIAFTGPFHCSFLGAMALTALVPIANIGLLWWQDRKERRKYGAIDEPSRQHHQARDQNI